MSISTPQELICADRWAVATSDMPAVIRYREPVLGLGQSAGYHRCLRVVWAYSPEGSGTLPDSETDAALTRFEDRIVEALEQDALAVLTAVVTLDGARQWVFYTPDVPACGAQINTMPQEQEPYPIELDAFSDPDWSYLRDEVLGSMS